MVDDDGREVVETRARVGAPRLVQVGQEVVGHVQLGEGELHVGVELRPGVGAPPEALQVQTKDLRNILMLFLLNFRNRNLRLEVA